MSRKIDTSDPSSLSREDILYLQERDILPAGVDPIMDPSVVNMALPDNTGSVTNDAPQGGTSIPPPVSSDSAPSASSYEEMTVSELKDEIDRRNENRDEEGQISKSGNKSDLIDALESDDDDQDIVLEES